ncbi:IclR family transcriptional regulator domain-containing protein [Amycolatopsis sp. BJA-103]|uniref:IclR family transcriptional regulator domain-containing protein n=1 Tax=Amycolatopsis sp. BJA-103 TaxID=1911175 RepID=UPI001E3A68BE|nr:hypothetical protein [Amycolatopsis sp. BJA-103]
MADPAPPGTQTLARGLAVIRAVAGGAADLRTLVELGFQALHGSPLPVVARPVLEELAAQLRDTVHLAVRDGDSVLYLDKLPGSRGAEMRSRIGHRMPLTRTGVGMALLLDSAAEWQDAVWRRRSATPPARSPEPSAFRRRGRTCPPPGCAA